MSFLLSSSSSSKEDLLKPDADNVSLSLKSLQTQVTMDNENSSNIESEEVLISTERVAAGEASEPPTVLPPLQEENETPAAAEAKAPPSVPEAANASVAIPSTSRTAIVESTTVNTTENYDDEPDESIAERLWALVEMFPEPVRQCASKMTKFTRNGVRTLYSLSCRTTWIIFSSAVILVAPVIFESERAQMKELQKSHEKQMLLGPSTVMTPSTSSRIKG